VRNYLQYFRRARFEWHPDDEYANPVQKLTACLAASLSALVAALRQPRRHSSGVPGTQYFSATSHSVRQSFLTYSWRNHGGLTVFGYPITERFEGGVSAINPRVAAFVLSSALASRRYDEEQRRSLRPAWPTPAARAMRHYYEPSGDAAKHDGQPVRKNCETSHRGDLGDYQTIDCKKSCHGDAAAFFYADFQ